MPIINYVLLTAHMIIPKRKATRSQQRKSKLANAHWDRIIIIYDTIRCPSNKLHCHAKSIIIITNYQTVFFLHSLFLSPLVCLRVLPVECELSVVDFVDIHHFLTNGMVEPHLLKPSIHLPIQMKGIAPSKTPQKHTLYADAVNQKEKCFKLS